MASPGNGFMHRTHADDLAGGNRYFLNYASPLEFADRRSCAEKLPCEVYSNHGVPLEESHLLQAGVFLEPGIAHHDVDRSEFLQHPFKHCFNLRLLRYIGLDCQTAHATARNDPQNL